MNEYERAMMGAPSIELPYCPFCGRPATNKHHIVPRSHGGTNGPTITVCGFGNASGCHGKLHDHRLTLRYTGEWEFLETREPTKIDKAMTMEGWRKLGY